MGGTGTGTAVTGGSAISGGPLSFETIYQTVMKAIGDASYARSDEVKSVCNMVYLNEILTCDPLFPLYWLLDCDDTRTTKAPATITGISAASPAVITAAAHGFVSGDIVTFYDVEGMTEINYRTARVLYVGADSFSLLNLDGSNYSTIGLTTYTGGGTAHFRGTLINNCKKILGANLHGYNKGMTKASWPDVEKNSHLMDVSTSRPIKYMHRQAFNTTNGTQYDYIETYPGSDASYAMRIWTEKTPARLVNTTDIPYLPHQFQDAIIAGAITRLGESKVQVEAGVIWPGVYERHLEAIRTFNRQWWHEYGEDIQRSGLFLA